MNCFILSILLLLTPQKDFNINISISSSEGVRYVNVIIDLKSNDFKHWKLMSSEDMKTWHDTGYVFTDRHAVFVENADKKMKFYKLEKAK